MASPPNAKPRKNNRLSMDTLMSLLSNDPSKGVGFMTIHRGLVKAGRVASKDYTATNRLIKRGLENGWIKQLDDRSYISTVAPEEFQVFVFLDKLRQTVGSEKMAFPAPMMELLFLGMPKRTLDSLYAQLALWLLLDRIAALFQAVKDLTEQFKIDRDCSDNWLEQGLPSETILQLQLEVIPYYLMRMGPSIPEMQQIVKELAKVLQQGGCVPDHMKVDLKPLKDELEVLEKIPRFMYSREGNEWDLKIEDFAMVVTPSEWLVDKEGQEEREIVSELKAFKNKGLSTHYVAHFLAYEFDDTMKVQRILNRESPRIISPQELKEIMDQYQLLLSTKRAVQLIDEIVRLEPCCRGSRRCNRELVRDLAQDKRELVGIFKLYEAKNILLHLPEFDMYLQDDDPLRLNLIKRCCKGEPMENIRAWIDQGRGKIPALLKELDMDITLPIDSTQDSRARVFERDSILQTLRDLNPEWTARHP